MVISVPEARPCFHTRAYATMQVPILFPKKKTHHISPILSILRPDLNYTTCAEREEKEEEEEEEEDHKVNGPLRQYQSFDEPGRAEPSLSVISYFSVGISNHALCDSAN